MPELNLKNEKAKCEAFATEHLAVCADELLEWRETAILKDGKVRELAQMVSEWAGTRDSLSLAERFVEVAALRYVRLDRTRRAP